MSNGVLWSTVIHFTFSKNFFSWSVIGDKKGISKSYNNIGSVYYRQNNYTKALKNYFLSLKICQETNNVQGVAIAYNNLGNVYADENKFPEALKNYLATLNISQEIGDKQGIASSYVNIGSIYHELQQNDKAEEYCLKSLSIAKEIGDLETIKGSNQNLSSIYSDVGRHKESLERYKAFIAARDSLINEENTKKTVQLQMNYEFDKKQAATQMKQDIRDKIQEAEAKKQRIVLMLVTCFLILVLILSLVIFRNLRINQKKNKIIELQKEVVEKQKRIVEEKQKEIIDSITYARRIQRALITNEKYIEKSLQRLMRNK